MPSGVNVRPGGSLRSTGGSGGSYCGAPLIIFENRQAGLQAAKALMKAGGVIACDAPRHPFPPMNPAVRAGLLEVARRLDPLVWRWGR